MYVLFFAKKCVIVCLVSFIASIITVITFQGNFFNWLTSYSPRYDIYMDTTSPSTVSQDDKKQLKHLTRSLVLANIISMVVIAVIVIAIINRWENRQKQSLILDKVQEMAQQVPSATPSAQTISPAPTVQPTFEFDTLHAYLAPEASWQKTEPTLNQDGLVVFGADIQTVTLEGTEWISTRTVTQPETAENLGYKRLRPSADELATQGWLMTVQIGDTSYSPAYADGGWGGGVDGYIRAKDNKIQLYLTTSTISGNTPGDTDTYPYQLEKRIFLSDPVDIQTLIQ